MILTTNPSLYYPELIKNGTTVSLCGLLSHENADISGKVIELIEELTDEDVLDNGEDGEDDSEGDEEETGGRKGKGREGMRVLVEGLVSNFPSRREEESLCRSFVLLTISCFDFHFLLPARESTTRTTNPKPLKI